jgi:energy-coupling factor transporter ATP-binding protein EcfA2
MRLGEILVARGLVSLEGIEEAIARQRDEGGRLGDNLVALELLTVEQFNEVIHETPRSPQSLEETGILSNNLLSLMLKFMYVEQRETPAHLVDAMKLPFAVVREIMDDARRKNLVQAMGSGKAKGAAAVLETRYNLTERGNAQASEALARNLYVGPAPVPLTLYQEQTLRQRITNEMIDNDAILKCFSDLIIPGAFVRKIGPAINSGRTVLLYGPPGNGKTSIATRTAGIFEHIVYIPYCVDIDGQIMQVFDSSVHTPAMEEEVVESLSEQSKGLRKEEFDHRWVACRRPTVVVGGELTLEMLDLNFSSEAKFYEAPMHLKALNGTFIIDDFGRQLVSPEALLNRWIVPMESRIDFFKLNTGKSFHVPFDELVIFSTNLQPDDLMDPAFLRRIPYKIELFEPSIEDFKKIFAAVAEYEGLEVDDDIIAYVIHQLTIENSFHLAYYQPKFIIDQVIHACKYEGTSPAITTELVDEALQNLYVQIGQKATEGAVRGVQPPRAATPPPAEAAAPPPPPAETPPPGEAPAPAAPSATPGPFGGVDLDQESAKPAG